MKAKFNAEQILNGNINYANSFIELVKKYEGQIFEVSEEPFGGYELELDGGTYALDEEELIIINGGIVMTEKEKYFLEDTRDILVGYDGCKTEQQLKRLINEARERLSAFLNGKIEEYENSL